MFMYIINMYKGLHVRSCTWDRSVHDSDLWYQDRQVAGRVLLQPAPTVESRWGVRSMANLKRIPFLNALPVSLSGD